MTFTALFAAMIFIMTAYIFHVPVGINGGYIHFGDALIYLAAVLLPQPYALAAGAIGGGLADFVSAPAWIPATLIIKILITLPFSHNGKNILSRRNIIAPAVSLVISTIGYMLAEMILFGTPLTAYAGIPGSFVQSGGSYIAFLFIAAAFDKAHIKMRLQTAES